MVPYAYASRGGDVVTSTPTGSGRVLTKWYHTQLVTEVVQREGVIVGQRTLTKIDTQPYQVTEGVWHAKLNVAPVSSIRVLHNTYNWDHIRRRMRKLGYIIEKTDYTFMRDGQWDVYQAVRECKQVGTISVYRPGTFTRKDSGGGTKISTSTTPDVIPISDPDHHTLPGDKDLDSWTPTTSSGSSGESTDYHTGKSQPSGSGYPQVEYNSTLYSPPQSVSATIDDLPSSGQKKGDVVYVRTWQSATALPGQSRWNQVYYKWNADKQAWDSSSRYSDFIDESYKGAIMSVDESDLGRLAKEIKAEQAAAQAAQQSSTSNHSQQPSGTANGYNSYTSSGGGGVIYGYQNTGNSTISWESGQTSQTVSTSTGVHTIYR